MTVAELIAKLQQLPQDESICCQDVEGFRFYGITLYVGDVPRDADIEVRNDKWELIE